MHRQYFLLALLLAVVAPAMASAQYVSSAHGPLVDRFSIEPYAGRYYDNVGTGAASFKDSGWLGGVRLGVATTDRARLIANVGYSQVETVGDGGVAAAVSSHSSETWLLTGGIELDVVPGGTRGALSVEAGRSWRRLQASGDPAIAVDQRQWETVVAPGFSIIQRIAPRADLRLGVHDYIWLGADPVSHNWTAVVGLRLR